MLRFILVRPGSTEYDEQGRIKGRLDVPLSRSGVDQAAKAASELRPLALDAVYCSPCQPAVETAEEIGKQAKVKVRRLEKLQNLDQGLWQGKLIAEVRQTQPKVYRRWIENPDTVCPPNGEMISEARKRIHQALEKVFKRHRSGAVVLVTPEPLASLVKSYLTASELGDLWKAECEHGQWEVFELRHEAVVVS
jgi:broad specificity phosphatase PhoE